MSNSNKLNTRAKSSPHLSGTDKTCLAENSELPNQKQNCEKNVTELDALSKVKLDPAVLDAKVTLDVLPSSPNYSLHSFFNEEVEQEEIPKLNMTFESSLLSMHKKEQLKLTPQQCALLMIYAQNLKSQTTPSHELNSQIGSQQECGFCKNIGYSDMFYKNHILKDKQRRVQCPILRNLRCRVCGGTGDNAHTVKYCPYKE